MTDKSRLVSVGRDNQLVLWDVDELQQRVEQRHAQSLQLPARRLRASLAVSAAARSIAVVERDGVALFGSESLERTLKFELPEGVAQSVATCPGKPILAAGTLDGRVLLFDLESGEQLAELAHGALRVLGLSFSPDGRQLVSTSEDSTVKLWNVEQVETPTEVREFTGHTEVVFCAAFSPDGRWLATGGGHIDFADPDDHWKSANPGEIKIWDVAEGKEHTVVPPPGTCVFAVRFDDAGTHLVVCSSVRLDVWDLTDVLQDAASVEK